MRKGCFSLLLTLLLTVAACVSSPLQTIPSVLAVSDDIRLEPVGIWSDLSDAAAGQRMRGYRLTRYGEDIDQFWLTGELRTGQRLVEAGADSQDGPVFEPPIQVGDLETFLSASFAALGYYNLQWPEGVSQSMPGSWSPARLFTLRTGRGLEFRGEMRWRVRRDRLDLALWFAESRVYAPRIEVDASAMLAQLH